MHAALVPQKERREKMAEETRERRKLIHESKMISRKMDALLHDPFERAKRVSSPSPILLFPSFSFSLCLSCHVTVCVSLLFALLSNE